MKLILWIAVWALSHTGTAYAESIAGPAISFDAPTPQIATLRTDTNTAMTFPAPDMSPLKNMPELKPLEIYLYSDRAADQSA